MSRRKQIDQDLFPYHVSARCHNREWFRVPIDEVWEIMSEQLFFLSHGYNFKIHSFVLMNNHFHLLVRTPEMNLSEGMRTFMCTTSRELNFLSGNINQVWGGRFFRTLIMSDHYFSHAYKYVYRNPVEAGLGTFATDYKYSTLAGLLGAKRLIFPVEDPYLFRDDTSHCIEWLNRKPNPEHWVAVGRALKKKTFTLSICPHRRKPLTIENDLL